MRNEPFIREINRPEFSLYGTFNPCDKRIPADLPVRNLLRKIMRVVFECDISVTELSDWEFGSCLSGRLRNECTLSRRSATDDHEFVESKVAFFYRSAPSD